MDYFSSCMLLLYLLPAKKNNKTVSVKSLGVIYDSSLVNDRILHIHVKNIQTWRSWDFEQYQQSRNMSHFHSYMCCLR